jgi:GWxTD domain-containing protein
MRPLFLCAALAAVLIAAAAPPLAAEATVDAALDRLAAGDTLGAIDELRHTDLERIGEPRWFILLAGLYRSQGTIVGRQGSQHVLERAVQLFPRDASVAMEMGLTYFAQTFYPDAVRHFERALAIDPDLCVAKYKLAVVHYERWKLRVNSYFDEAAESRDWLEQTVACDPDNLDAARRYVCVTYALGDRAAADSLARRFARRFPDVPEFPLVAGAVAFEDTDNAAADSAFAVAMELVPDEEWGAYNELTRNVLGYEDLDEYEAAPLHEQPTMLRGYWIGVDPDATTDLNELHLEHIYRTFRADLFFSHASVVRSYTQPQTRGWDTERGEFSIKWGWPDSIYASHGGGRYEVWMYATDDEPEIVVFDDVFLNGNLSVPADASIPLVKVRYMNQVSEVDTSIVAINGTVDAVAFKDDDFTCSIYTMLHVNADSMLTSLDVADLDAFTLRTRFFDENWSVEKDFSSRIRAHELPVIPGSKFRLFDVVRRYKMPFGRYHVACTLEDEARRARSAQNGTCNAVHLASSDLTSSEILFLRDGASGASFSRGGELLTPNPWRAYGEGQNVAIYFEIYNLTMVSGNSRYRVTYEIHEDPEKEPPAWRRLGGLVARITRLADDEPSVAQTIEGVGDDYRARERMAIDVSTLPEGRHRLWLTIEDLNSGSTWEMSRSFYKSGPSVADSR